MNKNKISAIQISMLEGISPIKCNKLLQFYENFEAITAEKPHHLHQKSGIKMDVLKQLHSKEFQHKVEVEINYNLKNNIKITYLNDDDYPYRLKECKDAPIVFYSKGSFNPAPKRSVAIVGTRKSTPYGIGFCKELIQELSGVENLQIVSGLAFGIDSVAHHSSNEMGIENIAVMGIGLSSIYPLENTSLANDILKNGAWLSEYSSHSQRDPKKFPKRNRIIAGLTDACIVIESPKKGGSLITARISASYNRDVFALPGRYNDVNSIGCNELIQHLNAHLLQHPKEFLTTMSWCQTVGMQSVMNFVPETISIKLTEQERKVYEFIRHRGSAHMEHLFNQFYPLGIDLHGILLKLEMDGVIEVLPGKMYQG